MQEYVMHFYSGSFDWIYWSCSRSEATWRTTLSYCLGRYPLWRVKFDLLSNNSNIEHMSTTSYTDLTNVPSFGKNENPHLILSVEILLIGVVIAENRSKQSILNHRKSVKIQRISL